MGRLGSTRRHSFDGVSRGLVYRDIMRRHQLRRSSELCFPAAIYSDAARCLLRDCIGHDCIPELARWSISLFGPLPSLLGSRVPSHWSRLHSRACSVVYFLIWTTPELARQSRPLALVTTAFPSLLGGLFPYLDHSRACSAVASSRIGHDCIPELARWSTSYFWSLSRSTIGRGPVIYDDMYRGPADWLLRSRH